MQEVPNLTSKKEVSLAEKQPVGASEENPEGVAHLCHSTQHIKVVGIIEEIKSGFNEGDLASMKVKAKGETSVHPLLQA
jgi:hypothetical protein